MLKTTILAGLAALGLGGAALAQGHGAAAVTDYRFSFEGPFGRFDQSQLQRGLQVYTEVCAACHGLRYVTFRELAEEGGPAMTEEQMRAFAAMHEVTDPATGTAEPAGALVAAASEGEDDRPGGSYVEYIGVLANARGRGVAKPLLATVIADAARRGRDRVGLEVDADSPTGADGLYRSMGWETRYVTESWHKEVPVT